MGARTMSFIPGLGLVKGMGLTLRRFFQPKVTIRYPEVPADVAVKFRGRLQLLYDEYGSLKCETCFQCAQACPIECIDMGGMDTKGASTSTGAPQRPTASVARVRPAPLRPARSRSRLRALRARSTSPPSDAILEEYDHDPARLLAILEATQAAFGHLPVGALKRISERTGAWYAMIYGTASFYQHLRLGPGTDLAGAPAVAAVSADAAYLAALAAAIGPRDPGAS